jgi:phosphoserine phosphatase
MATRTQLIERHPGARFLAFWDLDGTLLRGDCSLGYAEGGREVYAGLVRLAIERRLSAEYPDNVGYLACREDYDELERRVGGWLCDPFLAQIFAGAEEQVLAELAAEHFETTLRRYYFASSRTIFDGLAVAGVEQHVLSASPEVFVRSAAASLGLAPEGLHGIRVRIVEGRLTREVLHPITSAEGKTARLKEIVQTAQAETPDRPVFAIAAFGNDFATDGPFVAYVARQVLPAGTPLGVMINAGLAPAQYRHTFRSVRHVRVVADN